VPPTYLDRRTAPHITTLVIASALGPVALNVFLPSLPAMARHFDTDYAVMQLSVSLYLAAMGALQLVIGPASDRFGRRPVLLVSLTIFIAATSAAIVAPTVEILLVCRVFQAFSAAGVVLSRAVVGDTVDVRQAASRIAYVTMGMTLAPMIGPAFGGVLDELYGWQATFGLTLFFGILALVVVYLDLGETNLNPTASLGAQFRAYPQLLRSRLFWAYTLTAAFTSGAFFAFIGGAPYVSSEILGMSPSAYGFYFAILSLGYLAGNFFSGRYAARFGIARMMAAGNLVSICGVLAAIALFGAGIVHPLSLFGPMAFVGVGNGLTLPSANAGLVSVEPHLAGSASGLGGALQMGGGAALSVLSGMFLTPQSGVYPLLLVILFSAAAAVAVSLAIASGARGKAR
jgi:DHA1 family bicyclomycin/chloramphenicol resistance-like MFS transporter